MESLSPFLQGTCTPYNTSVYPGARRKTAYPESWYEQEASGVRRLCRNSGLRHNKPWLWDISTGFAWIAFNVIHSSISRKRLTIRNVPMDIA